MGLLHALHALQQRMVSPRQLAEEAIHVEQQLLGESVGVQDQIMAAHGGFRILELGSGSTWSVKNLLLPKDYLLALEQACIAWFQRNQPDCGATCQEQSGKHQAGQDHRGVASHHWTRSRGTAGFSKTS